MSSLRVIFFGARGVEFSSRHFARIIKTPAEVVAIVDSPVGSVSSTNKPTELESIVQASKRLGIPLFRPDSPKDLGFQEKILDLNPDLFISAGYWAILPESLLSVPRIAAVNFHGSLLPRHSGKHPVFWTLWYGDKETGITLHHMDPGIDTGDIVYVKKVKVMLNDTVASLYDRIMQASMPLIDRLIKDAMEGKMPRKPQSKEGFNYNFDPTENDFRLDFNQPSWLLKQRVKIAPNKCFFEFDDKKWFVMKCDAWDGGQGKKEKIEPYFENDYIVFETAMGRLVVYTVSDGEQEFEALKIKKLRRENG